MKELSPTARALLEAGRDAEESPNANDRARVQARLTALLGASAFGAAASQAAAMASLAGGTAATSGGTVTAGSAAAKVAGATAIESAAGAGAVGTTAANVAGASAVGAAAANVAGAGALGAAAAGGAGSGVAAGGGAAAASGWVAALGAKGFAWISAAALSAAVGTTAVVTRQSDENALEARAVAAGRTSKRADGSTGARSGSDTAAATSLRETGAPEAPPSAAQSHVGSQLGRDVSAPAKPQHGAALSAVGFATREGVTAAAAGNPDAGAAARSATGDSRRAGHSELQASRSRGVDSSSTRNRAGQQASDSATAPSSAQGATTEPETRISAARLAALAASSTSNAHRDASHDALPAQDAQESEAELLPQPTDPDQMNAVAASSRALVRAPQLPASSGTTPIPAINPGSTSAGATTPQPPAANTAAPTGTSRAAHPGVALAGELRLLADAQRALHDGKLSLALSLLDQHSVQHARGSLLEERLAARAVVLCRMHQLGPGNAEAQRLAALTPRSPLLPWVRSACNKR